MAVSWCRGPPCGAASVLCLVRSTAGCCCQWLEGNSHSAAIDSAEHSQLGEQAVNPHKALHGLGAVPGPELEDVSSPREPVKSAHSDARNLLCWCSSDRPADQQSWRLPCVPGSMSVMEFSNHRTGGRWIGRRCGASTCRKTSAAGRCVESAHTPMPKPEPAHLREYRYIATATPAAATPAPDMVAVCRGAAARLR